MRGQISIVIVLVCAISSSTAYAQSPEAEAVFREGKRLIKEGKLSEGCAKIEASERIESSTGTLLNLGDCREENKQLASAWAAFAKAATSAKAANDRKREAEARRRAKVLEARLGRIKLVVKHKVDGLTIRRNDATVDPALYGSEVPIDAGAYEIEASAAGYTPWTGTVKATDGATVSVEIPELEKAKVSAAPRPPKPIVEAKTIAPPDEEQEEPVIEKRGGTFSTTGRKVSVVLAGVGLVGVALGIKFGLDASDEQDRADKICPMAACTDPAAVKLNDDAQSHATLANVSFAVGGAAVIGAAVLWFVGAPSSHVEVVPKSNGVAIGGRF